MKARDVMVSPVITVRPSISVKDVATILMEARISAVPVVNDQGELVGIVSEGDLMRRAEIGTERQRSWWLLALVSNEVLIDDYIKAHAHTVADVMTRRVITAALDAPLSEIATVMEKNQIKRVPVVEGGQLVGIVSRANIVQAMATAPEPVGVPISDSAIRDKIVDHLKRQPWAHASLFNATVSNGVVNLWGFATSEAERKAIVIAAESIPGVRAVKDNMVVQPMFTAA